MAVDVSFDGATVHHTGRLMASVSGLALTTHHASKTTVSTAGMAMLVHHTDRHQPVQVASENMVVHHSDARQPVPVSGVYMVVHRSLGYYVAVTPLDVEPEIDLTGIRVKVFGGEKMRQAYFNVLLNHVHYKSVSVDYTTVPDSALPPTDYDTVSGTVTFAPGEISKIVVVPVREYDADISNRFKLLLSSPVNASVGDAQGFANL